MLHLRNHLLPLLRATFHASSYSYPPRLHRLLLSTASRPAAAGARFSVEEYLVGTCGLTAAQALMASEKLSRLKSASRPDAVVAVLSGVGLSRAELAAAVASDPMLLCAKADGIARRVASLRDRVGLSDPQIGSFLLAGGARSLRSGDIASKLEFWIPFSGSFDMLLRVVKGNYRIFTANIEKVVKPNVALLQECGLTVCDIVKMAGYASWVLTFSPKKVEALVQRAEELGVPRTSGVFKYTLGATGCITEGKATARMKFLSCTLGCSMDKLRPAVRRAPQILGLSEENLRSKIEFLVNKVALEPNYILQRPVLLSLSLVKRLAPRHYVLQVLAVKGLIKNDVDFYSSVCLVEEDFVARYIDGYKDAVPGLADVYAALRAGKLPVQLYPTSSD
ncbi:uncharacterized protein LOC102717289 [Oryza brachyantha]|uniref:Uncharacterized protein n=1 Tax=Oryza brachyantha TaxID=4533 RepID=J3N6P9_ORYBR|nr:uncharacterized protein LOC102717289 [Oryza brachyantha]